jgi:hypothetical protein
MEIKWHLQYTNPSTRKMTMLTERIEKKLQQQQNHSLHFILALTACFVDYEVFGDAFSTSKDVRHRMERLL